MVLTRKGISASSEAIIKEQRQITREKLLASPGLIIGTIGFLLILVTAILVPILNTQDPNAMVVMDRLKAPSAAHIFGTDELGRDLFIRVMYGARVSLWVGGCVAIFSCVLGTIIGLYASYFKVLDQILMRWTDCNSGNFTCDCIDRGTWNIKLECSCSTYNCIYSKCSAYSTCQRYGYS